jgi:hypothetical protein
MRAIALRLFIVEKGSPAASNTLPDTAKASVRFRRALVRPKADSDAAPH